MKAERAKVRAGGKVRDKAELGLAAGQRQGRVKAKQQATGRRGRREETGQRLGPPSTWAGEPGSQPRGRLLLRAEPLPSAEVVCRRFLCLPPSGAESSVGRALPKAPEGKPSNRETPGAPGVSTGHPGRYSDCLSLLLPLPLGAFSPEPHRLGCS